MHLFGLLVGWWVVLFLCPQLDDLEPFYPDRMASRILGMGDVVTLVEKAQKEVGVAAGQGVFLFFCFLVAFIELCLEVYVSGMFSFPYTYTIPSICFFFVMFVSSFLPSILFFSFFF